MKTPTSEDIREKLMIATLATPRDCPRLSDPTQDTAMVVTLEQLRPYEHNPRFIRNPLYARLKASIRERGLDQPPPITRRPGEAHFIIRNGGNTRLAILTELWKETHDERFFRIACLFRPWTDECSALLGHLAESDLHGKLSFIERALAVAKLKGMLEEGSEALSQRALARRLSSGGYPTSQSLLSRMFDTLEHLLPAIPQSLYAGLGKPTIERLLAVRTRGQCTWNQYSRPPNDYAPVWQEVMAAFDSDSREIETAQVQDELLARMAPLLGQSPRMLALDFHQLDDLRPSTPTSLHLEQPHFANRSADPATPTLSAEPCPSVLPVQPAQVQAGQQDCPPGAAINPPLPTSTASQPQSHPSSDSKPSEVQEASWSSSDAESTSATTTTEFEPASLRGRAATLAKDLAEYAGRAQSVTAIGHGLGFAVSVETSTSGEPRAVGVHLLLTALLGSQDSLEWAQRLQLPAALFGQLLTGAGDLAPDPQATFPIRLERLPDQQLLQLFELIQVCRRLVDLSPPDPCSPPGEPP